MHLVIYLKGKPNLYGYKRKEFKWDVSLGVYVWEGRRLTPEEFNEVFEKVQTRYLEEHPKVRVVEEWETAASAAVRGAPSETVPG